MRQSRGTELTSLRSRLSGSKWVSVEGDSVYEKQRVREEVSKTKRTRFRE